MKLSLILGMKQKHHLHVLSALLAGLICLGTTTLALGAPSRAARATPWWVDFWGLQTTLGDQPVPVGAVVRAYDPTGVLAGAFTVTTPGWYGLMPVYGDDPRSPEDEGARSGDAISFSINGLPAIPVGPETAVWTGSGTRRQVDLRGCSLVGDTDCDCRVDLRDVLRVAQRWGKRLGQAGYYPPYDADGHGIGAADVQRVAGAWRNTCQ